MAILGVFTLCFIALMVAISIIGRALIPVGFSPVKGDFEIVEMLSAFAILSFMPFAQLHRAHAQVSFISDRLGKMANRIIDFISDFFMLIIAALMAWRLSIGTIAKYENGETSFILQFPIWLAYLPSLFALYIWVLVAFWIIFANLSLAKRSKRFEQS